MEKTLRRIMATVLVVGGLAVLVTTGRCMLKLDGDYWVGTNRPYLMCYGIAFTVALGGVLIGADDGRVRRMFSVVFFIVALLTLAETYRLVRYMGWGPKLLF